MLSQRKAIALSLLAMINSGVLALPAAHSFASTVPGQTSLYTSYSGKEAPFPANIKGAILPTAKGKPGPEDVLWQNLLAAEWLVFSFYQQGVEAFNSTSFTSLGYPNTTYERITEIRDNEAGHMNAFYTAISDTSTKPGPCKYDFGFTDPESWLALQVLIEVSSLAFLPGLAEEAIYPSSAAAIAAIAEVESRHNAWALIDIWNVSPFSGPIDTSYPYPEQILALTSRSGPPTLDFDKKAAIGHPGSKVTFKFPDKQPSFESSKEYFTVYFHALANITVPFDPKTRTSTIPAEFNAQRGIIIAVITNEPGAPTKESCVSAPLILLQQPALLTQLV
ncbi:hypothetical protein LTR56_008341 [Elasticomyces elasticus]|nr:hypothetical protein LTR56_008341 [Elasticomyces elasticus]KAK3661477.1 hypothetical protein LTR22_007487 [Elasticomyces elasticus]KAK4926165.1 hypothetical protein LTR49_006869 [Elasticomyces elasticus]KAK5756898.1 hypothetical protein LTS12_012977 [Elasticomyces elasticus]